MRVTDLQDELAEAEARQAALASILRAITAHPGETAPVFDQIVEQAVKFCAAEDAMLHLVRGDTIFIEAGFGRFTPPPEAWRGSTWPLDRRTTLGDAILDRRTLEVPDNQATDAYPQSTRLGQLLGFRSELVTPIQQGDVIVGVLTLRREAAGSFSQRQIEAAGAFAAHAAIAIENVRLFTRTKQALERQTAIAEVLRAIGRSSFDLDDVLDTVLSRAATLVAADLGCIYRRVGDGMRLDAKFPSDFATASMREIALDGLTALVDFAPIENEVGRPATVPKNDVATAVAFREGRTVHVPDVPASAEFARWDAEPRMQWYTALTRRLTIRAELAVPLKRDDQILGILDLMRAEPKPFTADEIALLETFADQASIAIDSVRMFNEIQDKSAELAVASRHKSEFLANMSHELRTPLNAIIGFSDVLLEGMSGALDDRQREYVADIKSSGEHQLSLINDILDLSKVEAGRMDLDLTTFHLHDVVDHALALVRERAVRQGISLSVDVPESLPAIEADQRKVKQVVLNLLTNAVKFTPQGGWVGIIARETAGELQVSVRDTGIGIAPEDRDRVFEEFRQVGQAPQTAREGTGLGLALSKRFVELHGGRLSVESEVGKGSTFTMLIPVRRPVLAG